jgi:hypothetical protein
VSFEVTNGWITGSLPGPGDRMFLVVRRESPRPNGQSYIRLSDPTAFVIHTTEGSTVDGAWNTLNSRGSAPHFLVGEHRIIQMRPLWAQAATLRDNGGSWHPNSVGWQIESVGHASQDVHKLTPPSWDPLVAVTAFMAETKDVPLARPSGWRDDLDDITTILASDNTRRRTRKAVGFRGLLMHLEIPDQSPTWHWDAGALNFTDLIAESTALLEDEMDERLDAYREGWNLRKQGKPKPASGPWKRFGWEAAEAAFTRPAPGDPGEHDHGRHVHGEDVPVP